MKVQNSDVLESVVHSLCASIDSPRSLSVWLCFKYNHAALLELPMADIATRDSAAFAADYFITSYLQKYKGLKTGIDCREVALGKWKQSEVKCRETNARFRELQLRPSTGRVEGALFRAQRKIASVLGPLHRSLALDGCKWGPGATFDLNRSSATPDAKMTRVISVTAQALPFLRAVLESDPHWSSCFLDGEIPSGAFSFLPKYSPYRVVRGSRFLTVPKNAKTDRCIAAEPTGNSFLQQGVHSYMRRRLKRFGIDLDDQSINQKQAEKAYTSALSTLDLSAASDTITTGLIYHLLPIDWAIFLDSLRSHETCVNGEWIRTEKFVSMGNAFCFELESLIFWALASSVYEEGRECNVTVYGDDIIVDRDCYDSVVEILQFCGFSVNVDKSFKEGNFFESCGKHYHRGVDVTPAFQKEVVRHPSEFIRAHNRLLRLEYRLLGREIFQAARKRLANAYPLRPFPRIPYGVCDDGGFLRPLEDFSSDPNHGFSCRVLDYVTRFSGCHEGALYAYKLRRFSNLNPRKEGWAANPTLGKWRSRERRVPWHALASDWYLSTAQ